MKNRVFPAWLLFSINKRVVLKFKVVRKLDRQLDLDEICKEVYPGLKAHIDQKWLSHRCSRCKTRLVVMDGNAKVGRFNISYQLYLTRFAIFRFFIQCVLQLVRKL